MSVNDQCQAIQPILFAALENEVTSEERVQLHAHLAVCETCRSFERAERALTDLLDPHPGPRMVRARTVARVAVTATFAVAATMLLFLLPAATPGGSIRESRLDGNLTPTQGELSKVQHSNHLDIPANAAVDIDLGGGMRITATGPCRFELDRIKGRWKLVILQGNLRLTMGAASSIVVVNRKGRSELAVGTHMLSESSSLDERETVRETELSVAEMVAKGQRMYYDLVGPASWVIRGSGAKQGTAKRNADLMAAEKLLRQASTDPRVTHDQKESALFYQAACLGELGRRVECIAIQERWLKLFPNSGLRSLVLHYLACGLIEVGRTREAVRRWNQVIAEEPESSNLTRLARWYIENRGGKK